MLTDVSEKYTVSLSLFREGGEAKKVLKDLKRRFGGI
jgi:hypothetical protein